MWQGKGKEEIRKACSLNFRTLQFSGFRALVRLPQGGPLWHKDFELKVTKTQQMQEKLCASPSMPKFRLERRPYNKKRAINKDSPLPKELICVIGQPCFSFPFSFLFIY